VTAGPPGLLLDLAHRWHRAAASSQRAARAPHGEPCPADRWLTKPDTERQVLAAERIGAAVGVRCWSRDGRAMAGVSDTEAVGQPLVPRSADMARTCRASGATLWTSRGLLRPRVATAGCREYQDEPYGRL
jgi:hypothetical protein